MLDYLLLTPNWLTALVYILIGIVGWFCVELSTVHGDTRRASLLFCAFVFFCGVHHLLLPVMAWEALHHYWDYAMSLISAYAAFQYLVKGNSIYIPSPKDYRKWKRFYE